MKSKLTQFCWLFLVFAAIPILCSAFASNSIAGIANTAFVGYPNDSEGVRHLRAENKVIADEEVTEVSEERAFESTTVAELAKPVVEMLSASAKSLLGKFKPKGKSADALFTHFQVASAKSNLFSSTQFESLARAVMKANAKNSAAADMAMTTTLAARYGDETLANMLVAAKHTKSTEAGATKLANAQLESWLTQGKTADDVFTVLKLDQKGNKLFESPAVNAWVSYVTKVGVDYPDQTVFKALQSRFDDAVLAKMLLETKNVKSTKNLADKFAEIQITDWMRNRKTTDDVLKLLKLDEEGGKLLQNPIINVWTSYVAYLIKDPYELVLFRLKIFYDDEALVKTLLSAKEVASTKSIAISTQGALFKDWISKGKTVDDVFNSLTLEAEGTKLFDSPLAAVWASYVTKLDDSTLAFSRLWRRFGDVQLAKMLSDANSQAKSRGMETFTERFLDLELQYGIWVMANC
ncbi:hypothetical protein P3T76_014208 [Phytophthora citrophthora]|uniref:RxLR effector PexRD54 WY domain-containing protein n=1 Tax=Phytophthora citrophthora TaxID=4793 RepID=A0AAD9LBA1_9STRA|nr:hypothetical protein P3T76_014208 [Phytophthora citrophthora]